MEKIELVIVEDEFEIAEDLRQRLEDAGYAVTGVFNRADRAKPHILQTEPDILLVDIHLPGPIDGVELVSEVQKTMSTPIVYITANSDAATYARARATNPHAFLVKPFRPESLLAAVDLALHHFAVGAVHETIERLSMQSFPDNQFMVHESLFVRTNGKHRKVNVDEVLFVEAAGSYLHIQTTKERITLALNLTQFQKRSPLPNLVRVHRSYIINLNHVDAIEGSIIHMKDHRIPLSDNYREEFNSKVRML